MDRKRTPTPNRKKKQMLRAVKPSQVPVVSFPLYMEQVSRKGWSRTGPWSDTMAPTLPVHFLSGGLGSPSPWIPPVFPPTNFVHIEKVKHNRHCVSVMNFIPKSVTQHTDSTHFQPEACQVVPHTAEGNTKVPARVWCGAVGMGWPCQDMFCPPSYFFGHQTN